jgi:hypothetical protein
VTLWSEVKPGDVVRGARDGKAWEVLRRNGSEVTIRNEKREFTFAPTGPVEMIATADEMMAAAEAAIKIIMPGSVQIAQQDTETKVWYCPNTYPDAGSAQSHMFIMHGTKSKETDILAILAEHRKWHDDNVQVHPHVHSDKFWKGE